MQVTTKTSSGVTLPKVNIYDTPKKATPGQEFPICQEVFTEYGYCAEPGELLTWKRAWRTSMKKKRSKVHRLVKGFSKFMKVFKKLSKFFKNDKIRKRLANSKRRPKIFVRPEPTRTRTQYK